MYPILKALQNLLSNPAIILCLLIKSFLNLYLTLVAEQTLQFLSKNNNINLNHYGLSGQQDNCKSFKANA